MNKLRNDLTYSKNKRFLQKIDYFKKVCIETSLLSYDNKYKVGCIIFSNKDLNIISTGYNGNYRGGPNQRDSMESGKSGYVHSEINCLLNTNFFNDRSNYTLMCTWTPCWHCAKCIVNSGIKKAIFLKKYLKDNEYEKIFKIAKIEYLILEDETNYTNEELEKLKQIIN